MATNFSEYGKKIRYRLLDLDENQNWLIEQVKNRTGLYFDSSYLHKIMSGSLSTPSIVGAINEILEIRSEESK